jgi:Inner membrane component of T3SS, cytoplasmic domain
VDEVVWIEVLSRYGHVAARHRLATREIRVGRGYSNDIIIDDPYVAPEHLRVFRDEAGALVAEDIGSVNGTFDERGKERLTRFVLDGNRTIRIGHTALRVRGPGYAVPRERAIAPPARAWPIALGLAAVMLGLLTGSRWLGEVAEPKLTSYLLPALGMSLFVLAWTTGWAILSRIFSSQARFERNLVIALTGLLAYSLYDQLAEFLAFALASSALATYAYVASWSILALVCFFHLWEIGPTRLPVKAGVVTTLLAIAICAQTLTQSELRADFGEQAYLRRLFPPSLRLTRLQEEGAFFRQVERLKTRLDEDRTKEPSGTGIGGFPLGD